MSFLLCKEALSDYQNIILSLFWHIHAKIKLLLQYNDVSNQKSVLKKGIREKPVTASFNLYTHNT